jgi:hypothetical protein
LGSDFGTLIKQGVNYATVFDIGWMVRVYREEKLAVSASFQVTNGDYSFISISNFVNDIIDDIPGASIILSNNSLYGLGGVRAAYGVNNLLGFNIVADLGYGETIQRELDNKWFTILGFNADLNFSNYINTPIALSLGYLYSTYPENNEDVIFSNNIIITELSYIGRTNFILGLEFAFSKEQIKSDQSTVWLNTTMFSMRYLF